MNTQSTLPITTGLAAAGLLLGMLLTVCGMDSTTLPASISNVEQLGGADLYQMTCVPEQGWP